MPRISKTESIALKSGSKGIEKYLFDGTMSQTKLNIYKNRQLTSIDKRMLDKAPGLLKMVNEYETLTHRKTPPQHPFWKKAREDGFFSLIVPEEYGGQKMSATGLSVLLQSLSSCSASVPVHVMVPNSLGPSELLSHYGTEKQKKYYLPKLAKGAIPCFGLTSLYAGSDAAGSMTDIGKAVLVNGKPKLNITCDKRYITLAPVADIVGIAFKIDDKDGILTNLAGRSVHDEITLALVQRNHPGLNMEKYLDPLGVGFENGTISALNMEIDIEDVIGAEGGLGNGWKFLMEALAAGRGTALPAGAAGSSKMLTNAVSSYCTIRRQFKVPISNFEGIQEKIADMGIKTFEIDSLVSLMNSVLDNGEKPPILSAILKQRTTEISRDVVNHAMDICAGSAICMGPRNFVAPAYLSCPIGITVEGSNTMTRSLLIFGQGLIRSHPHMLDLIQSIENDDKKLFISKIKSLVSSNVNLWMKPTTHLSYLDRFSRFFAISANLSLFLGGSLKRREYLSGRYADLMSFLIAAYAMERHGMSTVPHLTPIFRKYNHDRIHKTIDELLLNHPHTYFHTPAYKRIVGTSTFDKITDFEKSIIANELFTYNSELRKLFDEGTLSHLHPTIKKMDYVMSGKNTSETLVRDILEVDSFLKNEI